MASVIPSTLDTSLTSARSNETSHVTQLPSDVAVVGLIFGVLCTLSALFGNVLIIGAVVRVPRLRQTHNWFVASMAVCELLMVCFRDSLMLATYGLGHWNFGNGLAAAFSILDITRNTIAVGHIVAITIYRYALIVHPKAYKVISRIPFLILVETFLIVYPVAAVLATSEEPFTTEYLFNTKGMRPSSVYRIYEALGLIYTEASTSPLTSVFAYLIVNVVILAGCYTHIFVFVQRSRRRVQCWKPTDSDKSERRVSRDVKFVQTMAIVFVTFVLSYFWTPILAAIDVRLEWSHWVYIPFILINWFSSSINWIVYGLTNKTFRQGFAKVLRIRPTTNGDISKTAITDFSGTKY